MILEKVLNLCCANDPTIDAIKNKLNKKNDNNTSTVEEQKPFKTSQPSKKPSKKQQNKPSKQEESQPAKEEETLPPKQEESTPSEERPPSPPRPPSPHHHHDHHHEHHHHHHHDHHPPHEAGKHTGNFSDKDTKYDDVVFANLPADVKRAVATLGFTQETWDNHGWVESEDKHWHDLTPEERKAAETLGWDETAWDTQYEKKYWEELPPVVKDAAASAGFSQKLWDDDEWPENLHKGWKELTSDDRRAMNVLGYHKSTWH